MSKTQLYEHNAVAKALENKWGWMLSGIKDAHVRANTSILLENENQRGGLITEAPVYPGGSAAAVHGVGTFSGQTANSGGFDFSAGDGTGSGADIAPFQHYLLPLVRRVYPNLIANELVGVQPMTSPASLVFYLKYRYTGLVNPDVVSGSRVIQEVQDKGTTASYTEYANFSGNSWSIDPYYSLQTIFREPFWATFVDANGTVTGGEVVAGAAGVTVKAAPVIENSVTIGPIGGTFTWNVTATGGGGESATVTYTLASFVAATGVATYNTPVVTNISSGVVAGTPASFTLTFTQTGATAGVLSASSGINFAATMTIDGSAVDGVASSSTTTRRTYDYNMEGNRQLPEMELQVESFPVSAKTRKLRTKWTIEAAQDLRAMHNIDAEQELIAVLANEVTAEIDREIINDLIVNAAIRVEYDYSNPFLVGGTANDGGPGSGALYGPSSTTVGGIAIFGSGNFDDRNKALFYQILECSNQIYRQSLRGAGNWVVTSPEVASKLESLLEFKPDARTDTTYNLGIQFSGTLNGQFKLYKDPLFPRDLILVGYKGQSFMDSGYFYCPYVPLQLTPTVLDTESFNPRKGLITRYGKVLVENGARMYARIRVSNLSAVGADALPTYFNGTVADPQTQGGALTTAVSASTLI